VWNNTGYQHWGNRAIWESLACCLFVFSEFAEVLSQARVSGFSAELQAFASADKGSPSARVIF
jgi:hypothetical protein